MRRSPPLTFNTQPPWTHCGGEEKKIDKKRTTKKKKKKKKNERRKPRWRWRKRNDGDAATVPVVVHRFPDLDKKKLRNADCCSGLLATFSKKKRNIRGRWEIEEEEEKEDDYNDNEAEDCARTLSCFSGVGAPALENKHRKDRNCFSERFDSRQMNLLKYTRNSTSRQYLHERGGRIYIRAGCTVPFKPPSVSTTTAAVWAMWM